MDKIREKQLAFIIIFLIVTLNSFFIFTKIDIRGLGFNRVALDSKPSLSGEMTTNPDFIYKDYTRGWLLSGWNNDWESDGWYENETVDGRIGVIVIHPYTNESGKFIQRLLYLPKGEYRLVMGLADIAGKMDYAKSTGCDDVGILIKIFDKDGKGTTISDEIINANQGWVDLSFDIGSFSGQEIVLRLESYGGGPCGSWRGEWAAVDYIDVIKI